jgi:hypothetical protein
MKALAKLGVIAALGLILATARADGGGETAPDLAGSAGPDASNSSTGAATGSGGPSSGRAPALPPSGPFQPGQTAVTVDGYGRTIAPVDTVILGFALVLDPGFDPIGTPCPPDQACPAPSVRPPASPPFSEQDLDPVLAAINQQGIADDQVTVIGRGAAVGAEIYVAVSDPRQLGPVVNAVSAATQASDRVALLSGAGISKVMSVEECRALNRQALDSALADARRRAQSMVEGFDVVVGEVVSVEERPTRPPCSLYEAIFDDEIGFRLPVSSYTPGQSAEETVVAEVTVTFAVQ